jgi:CelD/BcsL family acetyltransferase involved in cellulose biosynthesis
MPRLSLGSAGAGDAAEFSQVNWFGGGAYACSPVWGPESLTALRDEWADLHRRAPWAYVTEGFEWALLSWRACAASDGKRLVCLVVRHGAQLVAILPLVVSRQGLFRTARPLACQTTEYCPLLADPSADAFGIWAALVGAIRNLAVLDAVVLPHVRDDAPLAAFLKSTPRVFETNRTPLRYLSRSAFDTWESYWDHMPKELKRHVRRRRRDLSKLGDVRFEDLTDPGAIREAWKWIVAQKRDWLVRKAQDHAFIPTEEYVRFVEATLDISAPTGRRAIFALTLNGEFVAAELANVDRRRVEAFISTYDPAFSRYGVGNLLREDATRWAFARGLDFDWRLGGESYKSNWASHTATASTYVLARSRRGQMFGAYLTAHTWLANRTPGRLRAKIRGVFRLLRRSRRPATGESASSDDGG